jgi:hypothetical protein
VLLVRSSCCVYVAHLQCIVLYTANFEKPLLRTLCHMKIANAILFNFAFIIENMEKARNFEAGVPLEVSERIYVYKPRWKVKLLNWGNNRISVLTNFLCTVKFYGAN